jgi:hypothetical protein
VTVEPPHFAAARTHTDHERQVLAAIAAKIRARATLNRLKPTTGPDVEQRAAAVVPHLTHPDTQETR